VLCRAVTSLPDAMENTLPGARQKKKKTQKGDLKKEYL
jgi:hypothetical protein